MNHPVVWFEVLGKDGAQMQRYYSELFGWKIDATKSKGYGLVDTGTKAGIPGGVAGTFPGTRPWATFYVRANDPDATLKRAEKLGGKIVMPPTAFPEGPTIAFFSDPEGNVIGLVKEEADAA